MDKDIILIKPSKKYKEQFLSYRNDFYNNGEKEIIGDLRLDTNISFEEWLKVLKKFEKGEFGVSKSLYALYRKNDDKVIGTFTVCHKLDKGLYLYGGHIAGSICPSERKKGYARLSLKFALDICKKLNIQYVLLTCNEKNIASAKAIISVGGKLENTVNDDKGNKFQRYWINLGSTKLKPKNLKNSTVGVIAPSTNLKESNKNDIQDSIFKCNELGIKVGVSKNAYSISNDKKIKIKEKVDDIESMFENPKINGIFCAKGGQFCSYLLNHINFDIIKNNPKVFAGISDGTFLLNAIYAMTGLITFHMSDFKRFIKNDKYNEACFVNVFLDKKIGAIPQKNSWKTLKDGVGTGTLIGGNLTCFTMLCEMGYVPKDENIILFLEDLEGASSKQDIIKNINILKEKGIMQRVKGILLADYINEENIKLEDLVLPELIDYDFPIIKCHDFGHAGINCVLPVGAQVTLTGYDSKLIINEKVLQ